MISQYLAKALSVRAAKPFRITLVLILSTCSSFTSCQSNEDAQIKKMQPVGLQAVQKRKKIRIITRNNAHLYFIHRGQQMGFTYEIAKRFAQRQDLELEIQVAQNWQDLMDSLLRGESDIIAAGLTITPERQKKISFAAPHNTTDIHVVWGPGVLPIKSFKHLSGKKIYLRRSSSYFEEAIRINQRLRTLHLKPMKLSYVPEDVETEEIFEDIYDGEIQYTLADHQIIEVNQTYLPDLEMGPRVSETQQLAWAVHPDAKDLIPEIDAFFKELKNGPLYNIIYRRYYKMPKHYSRRKRDPLFAVESGKISPFDPLIQKHSQKYPFDWRLIAAQIYQESRFNPKAISWAGARGLYQLMPRTARELGISNPMDPNQSIQGGLKYLFQMYQRLDDVPDSTQRIKFALAAYNCGWGHLSDARFLARNDPELDSNRWQGVSQALLKLSKPKYFRKAKHGFVRGKEPVQYVNKIWRNFSAYKSVLEQ